MRTKNNTAAQKESMLEALKTSVGVISKACEICGIDRGTHYLWMKNDPEYAKDVESMEDFALDFVESAHYKNIEEGNASNIIFHLKTKGKRRGYTEEIIIKKKEEPDALKGLNIEGKKKIMEILDNPEYKKSEDKE